ncbi:MAG: sugar phosphate nucleotidyltransferase [Bilifractor sp.]
MDKPVLVVMAAGLGSRYGGWKQIDPVDSFGNYILDYSVYDAIRAGFSKVLFVINQAMEHAFSEHIYKKYASRADVSYVCQDLNDIPDGFAVPDGRTKPWGTAHAIYACRDRIHGPFAVINADDYYGATGFQMVYEYLNNLNEGSGQHVMIGYYLKNTITENGAVSRGICQVNQDGFLSSIRERTRIELHNGKCAYTEDDGKTWEWLDNDSITSMNFWGFSPDILPHIEAGFKTFLSTELNENPLKQEYFLPTVINAQLLSGKATVKVLKTADHWYGMTYQQDHPMVEKALEALKKKGQYPEELWEE